MKKYITIILLCIPIIGIAQVAPYSITPKWYFGRQAGLDFLMGSPVVISSNVNATGQEESTAIQDPSGNTVAYSDAYRLYDGTGAFKQFIAGNTSSTQGGVIIPDPASPTTQFYVITANGDGGGGGDVGATKGIYWYKIQKSGSTINVLSGPNLLATNTTVTEQLYAGSDDNGGYWVVTHQGGGSGGNQFLSWNITSSGVSSVVTSSVAGTESAIMWQGSIKINKCQTRLAAVYWTGKVEVYNWDNTTGKVTGLIRSLSGYSFAYGCEFSPDGNYLYFTSLVGNMLYQLEISTGTVYSYSGSVNNVTEMGTLQLAPDNKIYVDNVSNYATPSYIGVINNPNVSGAGSNYVSNGFTLNNGSTGFYPNIYRGIMNAPWINPNLPQINTSNCPIVNFSYIFQTYFLKNITTVVGSEMWDFGEGAGYQSGLGANPSHSYSSGGTFTVKMKVQDQVCNKYWTNTTSVNIGCVLPITFDYLTENNKLLQWTYNGPNDFMVQYSPDAINWITIGTTKDYYYGVSDGGYYRVVQDDNRSQIIYVKGIIKQEQYYIVSDVLGRVLYEGYNSNYVDNLPSGVYIVNSNYKIIKK